MFELTYSKVTFWLKNVPYTAFHIICWKQKDYLLNDDNSLVYSEPAFIQDWLSSYFVVRRKANLEFQSPKLITPLQIRNFEMGCKALFD